MKKAYLLHTGYGKTKMCLDIIMRANKKPRVLLISTKKIVENTWQAEINKWYKDQISYTYITGDLTSKERLKRANMGTDILGINTESIIWYLKNTTPVTRKTYRRTSVVEHHDGYELLDRFDLIILDEVSLFKNSQSERFKAIKRFTHKMKNVIALSASPTPKNIEDIWSIIYLLDGGKRLGTSITKFRENYAIAEPLFNGGNKYTYTTQSVDHILSLVKDIVVSEPEPAQPLYPEPVLKKLVIKPDDKTSQMLKDFKQHFILKLQGGKEVIALSKNQLITKINQIASGSIYTQSTTEHLNDLKLRVLLNRLKDIDTPVLLIYHYVFDLEKLKQIPNARVLQDPQDFIDWNNNKVPIGILSPYSAAHGLNLQDSDCKHIFWFSPIWDTDKWIQTNARVCRRGQKNIVTIYVMLLKESYDEYAFNLCIEKFNTQNKILKKLK